MSQAPMPLDTTQGYAPPIVTQSAAASSVAAGATIGEISCPTRYAADSSSINLRRSIRYGLGVLRTCADYRLARHGLQHPEYLDFEPGKMTKVEFVMTDVCHTFRRGHRIMVQVQSSWFPLVDRNPQKFCDIYHAGEQDFQRATQRVYHSPQAGSRVSVLVLAPAN